MGLIKIDVEGGEVAVLRGAARTLARDRPAVLVEAARRNLAAVRAFFAGLAYREETTLRRFGVPGSPGNLLFLPK